MMHGKQLVFEGEAVELKLIYRVAMWLLSIAFVSGFVLAGTHFMSKKRPPIWMVKLHGYSISGAVSLLLFSWVNVGLDLAGSYGLLALILAAALGLVMTLVFRARQKPPPDGLVFVHMCVAFLGTLMIFLASFSNLPQ